MKIAPTLFPPFFQRRRVTEAPEARVPYPLHKTVKFSKYSLAAGLCPDHLGELNRSPRSSSGNKGGLLLRGREGKEERKREGKGREGSIRRRDEGKKIGGEKVLRPI